MSEWTKTPPTEPGWYWWRDNGYKPMAVEVLYRKRDWVVYLATHCGLEPLDEIGGEWWTTKIEEPK